MSGPVDTASGRTPPDPRHAVGSYFRLERWELPSPPGGGPHPVLGGRAPLDDHQRGAGGGLRTGALLTVIDSLGGFLCGLSVLPEWIVTTSVMATVARLDHQGPLGLHGRVLRRGRSTVVSALDVVDEGADDRPVASAVLTCAVLDPGPMDLTFARPVSIPMAPPDPEPLAPEDFFRIAPGTGPVTRLELADHLRNPWGILHGGAVAMLADVASCRAVSGPGGARPVAAADTVLHYLRPAKVGPVEARCQVLGGDGARGGTAVRVAVHDLGHEDRLTALGTVTVLDV